jgi:hypothetical protein
VVAAFMQELARSGWGDGRNVQVEQRWTNADINHASVLVAQLIASQPAVIFASANADEIRDRDQPQDGEGAWPYYTTNSARHRRRGD